MRATEPSSDGPLVTVVVTTYNRPEYLRSAVETVTEQRYAPIELVVVDDCSQTPASEVLADVSPDVSSFEIVRHRENRGANAARNTGVEAATGTYVAFLDDDDRWEPEKLAKQVDRFRAADDDVGLVYVGRKGMMNGAVREVVVPDGVDGDVTKALLLENVVGTQSAAMVRADLAKETPFDERFKRWADLEWYVALSTKCDFEAVREPLVIYEHDAHNRISNDYENLLESHRLFVEKYRDLAAGYGPRFERKMLGWASFRVGSASISGGSYDVARRYFLRALRYYPVEPKFYAYAAATIGGRATHRIARSVNRLVSSGPIGTD
ncbi:glycosyltransferase family 2 protein [Halogeometricum limi]|uniref:Glycosyltransferase involved in cell wall bisynthesis n=1 Tax=Halogeometricum limi TaxID=555875 RepID=A0A1I6IKW9_9EURY|nr:glycosyltransferase family 2 protein [Halogeometricum limi]SFR67334.1 Glycosyltransferase involved in cell wall bisynthesis [Halogeometricum limi]